MARKYPFNATMKEDTIMLTPTLPPKNVPLKKGTAVAVTNEIDKKLAVIEVIVSSKTQTGIVSYGSYDRTN